MPWSRGEPMNVFTYHLAEAPTGTTVRALLRPPTPRSVSGLHHAECMATMRLGARLVSSERFQLRRLAMFAAWENEAAIDAFLATPGLGHALGAGWHVRMAFRRRWGNIAALAGLPESAGEQDPAAPVVAVTLARLKLSQLPRFIRWGRPVEELVRDDPHATLATAGFRPPRTFSTLSVWTSLKAMTDMVHGHGPGPRPERHATAMAERRRKDFHTEFATYRFRPLSEHGTWQGRARLPPP